jgi:hypothetical protein
MYTTREISKGEQTIFKFTCSCGTTRTQNLKKGLTNLISHIKNDHKDWEEVMNNKKKDQPQSVFVNRKGNLIFNWKVNCAKKDKCDDGAANTGSTDINGIEPYKFYPKSVNKLEATRGGNIVAQITVPQTSFNVRLMDVDDPLCKFS